MSKNENAVTHDDIAALIENLPSLVAMERHRRGMSLRAVATETALPFSIVHRIERGHTATTPTIAALVRWLGTEAEDEA